MLDFEAHYRLHFRERNDINDDNERQQQQRKERSNQAQQGECTQRNNKSMLLRIEF